ncbi:Uncharacterised protein [Vibrio cholerae]|nr:hypothetical protein VS84_03488 [Vibrio cholerae]KKP11816.1 hypothetical protein VS85_02646 [Vibrio cholerae]KKP20723.1 hypothetical protein VS86_01209 [Vibrio cholerae]CSC22014.1 Uncharacterised protein [Vibrio cholerae]CSI26804.1 Uncharacterised protein [Vibrio cholerae]
MPAVIKANRKDKREKKPGDAPDGRFFDRDIPTTGLPEINGYKS